MDRHIARIGGPKRKLLVERLYEYVEYILNWILDK
jgi:hypothetical protein